MITQPPFKTIYFDLWRISPVGDHAFPAGSVYMLTGDAAPSGFLLGLFYNGLYLVNPLHYTLTGRTVRLHFQTQLGDNLYAAYMASSWG
jgi:hypothetical protein